MESRIVYFEKPGRENTDAVMEIVKKRAEELGIKTVVVASYRGFTAEKAVTALEGMNIVVIAGLHEATAENLTETFSQGDEKLIKSRAKVLVTTNTRTLPLVLDTLLNTLLSLFAIYYLLIEA